MIRRIIVAACLALFILAPTGCEKSGPSPEELLIQQLEEARKVAEGDADRWKLYAIIAACAGGVLLLLGVGLGSSARKEAERVSQKEQRKGNDED
jgi:hypothetical protein